MPRTRTTDGGLLSSRFLSVSEGRSGLCRVHRSAMASLCAQHSTQELAVIRDFIARFNQVAYEETGKLREGGGHAKPVKGSRPTTSA